MDKDTEKRARLAQAYGAGDVKVAQIVGQYPPGDYLTYLNERASTKVRDAGLWRVPSLVTGAG